VGATLPLLAPGDVDMGVTREIARFVRETSYEDVPPNAVAATKLAILNILGTAVAGARTRIGALHIDLARDMGGGNEQATILGDGGRVSMPAAAYANGNLAFALDWEDTLSYITHPGFITVSSGLAVGENLGSSGRDFLLAVALGYEVMGRMGPAMQPTPERGKQVFGEQYHPFAGAVTAGKLLGLDDEQMDSAFGIAGTYAPVPSAHKYFGVVAETRPMREVKLGWGWMCMAGTLAALSASRGFGGGHGILDGDRGFYVMAGSDRCDVDRMTADLGTRWLVTDVEPKVYPAIARNTPPHLATRALVAEHGFGPDEVERVTVRGMQMSAVADFAPATAVDAQFSLPHAIATALLQETPGPDMFSHERLFDPEVRRLMGRVQLEHDTDADVVYFNEQRLLYSVEVELTDGRRLSREIEFPRDRPRTGWSDICTKFQTLCDGVLTSTQIDRAVELVDGLDRLDDLDALIATLVPANAPSAHCV
jgi:2-methylcitrate dehydratase PrpD